MKTLNYNEPSKTLPGASRLKSTWIWTIEINIAWFFFLFLPVLTFIDCNLLIYFYLLFENEGFEIPNSQNKVKNLIYVKAQFYHDQFAVVGSGSR